MHGTGADDAAAWGKRASSSAAAMDATERATERTTLLGSGSGSGSQGNSIVDDGDSAKAGGDRWDAMDDFIGTPWWQRPSVYWLLLPYFIFTLAFGGALVPKLNLILSFICKEHFSKSDEAPALPVFIGGDNPQCKLPEVQSKVAAFTLVMTFLTGLLSALVVPRFGSLSDRYGRTRLMAVASCGGVAAEIITLLAAKYPDAVNYRWLVLGSVLDGSTGSFTAGSLLTQSYTSDCTPPSRRAVSIGFLHACLFSGLAFGPLLAGFFVRWTGSLLSVFYIIVACHILFILFVGLVMPESLSRRRRLAAQDAWAKGRAERAQQAAAPWTARLAGVNPFASLRILWPTGPGTSPRLRLNLVSLAVSDMIILGSSVSVGPILILYSEYQFGWGTWEASVFVSVISLTRTVILLLIFPAVNYLGRVRPAQRRRARGIATPETNSGADRLDVWVIRVAIAAEVVACAGYTLARSGGAFFLSGMIAATGGLASATIQAVITKHVPSDKVGQVLGAIGMLHALSRVIGPVAFHGIYSATVKTVPQVFLIVLGAFFCVALVGAVLLKPHVYWSLQGQAEDETEPLTPGEEILGANRRHTLPIDEDQVTMR